MEFRRTFVSSPQSVPRDSRNKLQFCSIIQRKSDDGPAASMETETTLCVTGQVEVNRDEDSEPHWMVTDVEVITSVKRRMRIEQQRPGQCHQSVRYRLPQTQPRTFGQSHWQQEEDQPQHHQHLADEHIEEQNDRHTRRQEQRHRGQRGDRHLHQGRQPQVQQGTGRLWGQHGQQIDRQEVPVQAAVAPHCGTAKKRTSHRKTGDTSVNFQNSMAQQQHKQQKKKQKRKQHQDRKWRELQNARHEIEFLSVRNQELTDLNKMMKENNKHLASVMAPCSQTSTVSVTPVKKRNKGHDPSKALWDAILKPSRVTQDSITCVSEKFERREVLSSKPSRKPVTPGKRTDELSCIAVVPTEDVIGRGQVKLVRYLQRVCTNHGGGVLQVLCMLLYMYIMGAEYSNFAALVVYLLFLFRICN
jgi:hypothetical protein